MQITKIGESNDPLEKDLVIYFITDNMDLPKIYIQSNYDHPTDPDEVACMVSFVPTFLKVPKII